jgi:hypothetical protein
MVPVIPYLIGCRPGDGDVVVIFPQSGLQVCAPVAQISEPAQLSGLWTST